MIELILGGARSGKSRFAEQRVQQIADGENSDRKKAIYIATATAGDEEMRERISMHRQQREISSAIWQTREIPIHLAQALRQLSEEVLSPIVLVDCLTLWLSNCLHAGEDCWRNQREEFFSVLENFPGTLILVSNEVGFGVVPLGELSRRFVDEAGRLHQQIAAQADRVVFCIAGLPQVLKG
jgi:adenosylcobinamide kinase/adenosylcobinamide-phosphate guanylyltransferase